MTDNGSSEELDSGAVSSVSIIESGPNVEQSTPSVQEQNQVTSDLAISNITQHTSNEQPTDENINKTNSESSEPVNDTSEDQPESLKLAKNKPPSPPTIKPVDPLDESITKNTTTNLDTTTSSADSSSPRQETSSSSQQTDSKIPSLYSNKQPPKQPQSQSQSSSSGSQWSSLFKRAIATVESTIDNVIEESVTSDIGSASKSTILTQTEPSKVQKEPTASTPPTSTITKNDAKPSNSGRLTMQERLAMAMKKSATSVPSRSSTASPRLSIDNASPRSSMDSPRSSTEIFSRPQAVLSSKALGQVNESADASTVSKPEPLPTSVNDSQTLKPKTSTDSLPTASTTISRAASPFNAIDNEQGGLILPDYPILNTILAHIETLGNDAESSLEVTEIKKDFEKFVSQLKARLEVTEEELSTYIEKTSSLESKLVFLAREEAERAKAVKMSSSGMEKKLAAKEEQFALLIEEGQLMSKKELKHMNTIKSFRSKAQDQERIANDAQDRQFRAEKEVAKLKEKIKTFSEIEKRQSADIKSKSRLENELENLRKERSQQDAEIEKLKEQVSTLQEKNNEEVAAQQTKALEAEKERSTALQQELSKVQLELTVSKEKNKVELAELESRIRKDTSASEETQSKMDKDIRALQAKVEVYRSRFEELSSGTSSDSQLTLLRQIEVLQSQHNIATENWTGIEQNLQNRITSLEQQLEESGSRENYFRKKVKTLVCAF